MRVDRWMVPSAPAIGSPIIDGPEIAHIHSPFRMILGVAGGRLSLLSRTKAFIQSREDEGL